MSVQVCPACRRELDELEPSIYCEHCGANVTRPPAPPEDE